MARSLDPREYFLKISEASRQRYRQPATWGHVIAASLDQARQHSSFRHEPLLLELLREVRRRMLVNLRGDPQDGLTDAELTTAAARFTDDESRAGGPASTFLHERVLHWLSDFPSEAHDWTLPLWRELLTEFRLEASHFVGQAPWPTERAASSEAGDGVSWEEELASLVGLPSVKAEVEALRAFLHVRQLRQEAGLRVGGFSLHQVFAGNPGTGKTSVARILAKIYRQFGFLSKGHLVETSRTGLVGSHIGETEKVTAEVIRTALGGVLFIDEAYSLARGGEKDFGTVAIDTLVKMMEDHRDNLVVIVAGYGEEMQDFLNTNPGLSSRFNKRVHFPDYSEDELVAIMRLVAGKESYELPDEVAEPVMTRFRESRKQLGRHFGNARDARNLWEEMMRRQAVRLLREFPGGRIPREQLTVVRSVDLPPA